MSNISALSDSVHILVAALSLVLSLLAPRTAARRIDPNQPVLAVSWLQLVVTWGSFLLLGFDASVGSESLKITSPLCTLFFGLAAAVQLGKLRKDASRVWTYYSWSWILGCLHEVTLVVRHGSTHLDIKSGRVLAPAVFKLLGYIALLFYFVASYETKRKPFPAADRDSPDYINRPVKNEVQEFGGMWPWVKEFRIFGAIIWPTGNSRMQACLVASIVFRGLEKIVSASCANYQARLIDAVQHSRSGRDFQQPLLLWFILRAVESNFGLPVARSRLWTYYTSHRNERLERLGYEKVLTLGHSFHGAHDPSITLETYRRWNSITKIVDSTFMVIIPTIISTVIGVYHICSAAGYSIIPVIVIYLSLRIISTSRMSAELTTISSEYANVSNAKQQHCEDSIRNWRTITTYNQTEREISMHQTKLADTYKSNATYHKVWYRSFCISEAVCFPLFFVGIWLTIYRGIPGEVTAGTITAYTSYWSFLTSPLVQLQDELKSRLPDVTFSARFRRLLELKPHVRPGGKDLVFADGTVQFEHIHFGYNNVNILEDFNISIAGGTKVAIVGSTGVGKSTIFNLLLQRSPPTKGRIFIDGQDLSGLRIASILRHVGTVDQPGQLLNRSILENLLLAKPGATLDEVRDICRKVQIDEEIMQRPGGYDSPAGVDGRNLSGGQKQKLMIARLLLELPQIALIDEGTSALDVEVESAVKKIIHTAFSGRTVIFVAHRLSSVKDVDRILVLEAGGRVSEDGTHEELLAKKGRYWRLWQRHIGE